MNHDIYLRCHTRILDDKAERKRRLNPVRKRRFDRSSPDPRHVLLLDAETTTDSKQNLNFGAYQFCERDLKGTFVCLEEGLFYADDLDATQTEVLRKYVRNENRKRTGINSPKLKLYSRDAFGSANTYDASGRLVEIAGATQLLLSPIGEIANMSGQTVNQARIPLPGGPTQTTSTGAPGSITFMHKDWLGSVRLVSDRQNRTLYVDRAFAPYGEPYAQFGATATQFNFTGDNQDLVAGTLRHSEP